MFVPHSEIDLKKMFEELSISSLDDLFTHIPETLKFGELGKMFNPGNIKELADSIEEVLINKDKYKIIEKAARKHVVKNFSSVALKERYLNSFII